MTPELETRIVADGSVALRWTCQGRPQAFVLLIVRSGSVPAHTALALSPTTLRYQINNLSRHQRYRVAVAALDSDGPGLSAWHSVTPRTGLAPRIEDDGAGLQPHLARVERLTVMPQDQRLTAYWQLSRGFVDQIELQLWHDDTLLRELRLEPEVRSLSLDASRDIALDNRCRYEIRIASWFAGQPIPGPAPVCCCPAPQGEERSANRALPQRQLIFPYLSLAPELQVFDDDPAAPADALVERPLICSHCQREVRWQSYRLVCAGCQTEYLPNGRGDYLEVSRLRFGTCRCCLPKKILIQPGGREGLRCAHSGKEHIRLPGRQDHTLIEDLPLGLCQCCRPRRPLLRRRQQVVCSQSGEQHQNESGRYVLQPSAPVFDAAAIDELLDAGLADICATGVSRGRPQTRRSR